MKIKKSTAKIIEIFLLLFFLSSAIQAITINEISKDQFLEILDLWQPEVTELNNKFDTMLDEEFTALPRYKQQYYINFSTIYTHLSNNEKNLFNNEKVKYYIAVENEYDNTPQGLMKTIIDNNVSLKISSMLTAPWNLFDYGSNKSKISGVGTELFLYAYNFALQKNMNALYLEPADETECFYLNVISYHSPIKKKDFSFIDHRTIFYWIFPRT